MQRHPSEAIKFHVANLNNCIKHLTQVRQCIHIHGGSVSEAAETTPWQVREKLGNYFPTEVVDRSLQESNAEYYWQVQMVLMDAVDGLVKLFGIKQNTNLPFFSNADLQAMLRVPALAADWNQIISAAILHLDDKQLIQINKTLTSYIGDHARDIAHLENEKNKAQALLNAANKTNNNIDTLNVQKRW